MKKTFIDKKNQLQNRMNEFDLYLRFENTNFAPDSNLNSHVENEFVNVTTVAQLQNVINEIIEHCRLNSIIIDEIRFLTILNDYDDEFHYSDNF